MATDTREQAPRDKAVRQLKKRRDFRGHLLICVLVNAFLVVIWAVPDLHGFFWPVFPIGIWGSLAVLNGRDIFWRPTITGHDIQHEMSASKSTGADEHGAPRARAAGRDIRLRGFREEQPAGQDSGWLVDCRTQRGRNVSS